MNQKRKSKTPKIMRFVGWLMPKLEKLSPWLMNRMFYRLFFRPVRYKTPPSEKEVASEATTFTINYKDKEVMVYQWGFGRPILLVHGWMGRGTQFRKFIPEFTAAGFQVVTFDAIGHGQSQGRKTDIIEMAEIIELLGKRYDFEMTIGHSIGGIATMHAIIKTKMVQKHVMISSPTNADKIVNEFLRRLNLSDRVKKYFYQRFEEEYGRPFADYSGEKIIDQLQGVELKLIHDDDDIEVTIDNAEALLNLYEPIQLVKTSGLGHTRILKDEQVIQECLEFARSGLTKPQEVVEV